MELTFPIGSKYVTQEKSTNPNTILGFGTWELSEGEVLVGIKDGDADFEEFNQQGGSKYLQEHTHTGTTQGGITSFLRHVGTAGTNHAANHTVGYAPGSYVDKSGNNFNGANHYHWFETDVTGEGDSGNLQPYRVVGYVWIRVNDVATENE